jgi:hypothetical protein
MEAQQPSARVQLNSLWSEKRLIAICFFIALAQFQYGFDSAAVSGFQSMPGFLIVFGYVDVSVFSSQFPYTSMNG